MQHEDHQRLRSLQLYQIVDTANEKAFDDLTKLAASICGTPISLISLIDEHRQWFKSKQGLDVTETPRDQAFCSHAIHASKTMIVEDASRDERFANNPLVTGDPKIRFYAGAPLEMADGSRLGTLCVIDRVSRQLTDTQIETLGVLRDAVVNQLELRRAIADLNSVTRLIPMCAWCRSVRTEGDSPEWQPLHQYVTTLTPVTHGMCPDCAKKHF